MLCLFQTVFVPQFHGEQLQGKDYNLECPYLLGGMTWMDGCTFYIIGPKAQEKPCKIKLKITGKD